jgi:hypothetical protein
MRISLDWLGVSTFRPVIDDLTVPRPASRPRGMSFWHRSFKRAPLKITSAHPVGERS